MIKIAYILTIVLLFAACIDTFSPNNIDASKLVVFDGYISNESDEQIIKLSWSSNTIEPFWDPLMNAEVVVVDKGNNRFEFTESTDDRGIYTGNVFKEYLVEGNAFKIAFTLSDGRSYESDFEEFNPCPEIDSVYYEIDNDHYVGNSSEPEQGVEFFVDLIADKNYTSYFRWALIETYEYRASWPFETYWAGEWYTHPADYSLYFCYMTNPVFDIFSTTTDNLDANVYLKYPLHFVNTKTQKLYYRYNLLVKQLSISEQAYNYWENLKQNNQTSGGLYDAQPQQVVGNLSCITNPNEVVLGYFGVAGLSSVRVNIERNDLHNKLIYKEDVFCGRWRPSDLSFITNSLERTWPIYMAPTPEGESGLWYAQQHCLDCRQFGGVLEEPEIWRNDK